MCIISYVIGDLYFKSFKSDLQLTVKNVTVTRGTVNLSWTFNQMNWSSDFALCK